MFGKADRNHQESIMLSAYKNTLDASYALSLKRSPDPQTDVTISSALVFSAGLKSKDLLTS